jgi:hypothetical protein
MAWYWAKLRRMEGVRPAGAAEAEMQTAIAVLRRLGREDPGSVAALLLDVLDSMPLEQVLPEFQRRLYAREEQLDREFAETVEQDWTFGHRR